jgi:hypothetical protein
MMDWICTYHIEQIYQRVQLWHNHPNTTIDGIKTVDNSIDAIVHVRCSHQGKLRLILSKPSLCKLIYMYSKTVSQVKPAGSKVSY